MKDTLLFLQSLLKTAAGIPFARISYTKPALQTFLQNSPVPERLEDLWQKFSRQEQIG